MPSPVTIPIANDKSKRPARMEVIRVLKPAMSNTPKSVSVMVAAHANDTVNELGKIDITAPVYSSGISQPPNSANLAPSATWRS